MSQLYNLNHSLQEFCELFQTLHFDTITYWLIFTVHNAFGIIDEFKEEIEQKVIN